MADTSRTRATHSLAYRRPDKEPITLDELAAFVQDCLRAEVPGDTVLSVRLKGFTGLMNAIETKDPR